MTVDEAVGLIVEEFTRASNRYAPFNSPHEGYAVILEELDEMWTDIKRNGNPTAEAVHVGAMALRFLVDLCRADRPRAEEAA